MSWIIPSHLRRWLNFSPPAPCCSHPLFIHHLSFFSSFCTSSFSLLLLFLLLSSQGCQCFVALDFHRWFLLFIVKSLVKGTSCIVCMTSPADIWWTNLENLKMVLCGILGYLLNRKILLWVKAIFNLQHLLLNLWLILLSCEPADACCMCLILLLRKMLL